MRKYSKRREIPFYAEIFENPEKTEALLCYAFQLRKGDIRSGTIKLTPKRSMKNPHYAALKGIEILFQHIKSRRKYTKRKIRIIAFWNKYVPNGYSQLKKNLECNLKENDVELEAIPITKWNTILHKKIYHALKKTAASCAQFD